MFCTGGLLFLPSLLKAKEESNSIQDFMGEMVDHVRKEIPGSEKMFSDDAIWLTVCDVIHQANDFTITDHSLLVNKYPNWKKWVRQGVVGLCQLRIGEILGEETKWVDDEDPEKEGRLHSDGPMTKSGLENYGKFMDKIKARKVIHA